MLEGAAGRKGGRNEMNADGVCRSMIGCVARLSRPWPADNAEPIRLK